MNIDQQPAYLIFAKYHLLILGEYNITSIEGIKKGRNIDTPFYSINNQTSFTQPSDLDL